MSAVSRTNRMIRRLLAIVMCIAMLYTSASLALAESTTAGDADNEATTVGQDDNSDLTTGNNTTETSDETTTAKKTTTAETTVATTEATTVDEKELQKLESEYKKLETKINQNEKKLDTVESSISTNDTQAKKLSSQMSDIKSQISILNERLDLLDGSISTISSNIETLNSDISELDTKIKTINNQITTTKSDIDIRYNLLKERMRAAYVTGNVSDLQILLSSQDFSAFLNNAEMIKRVAEYDTELISGLESDLEELNALNTEMTVSKDTKSSKVTELSTEMSTLTVRQSDAESSSNELESKQSELSSKYAETQELAKSLDQDSEEYKALIAEYKAEQEAVEAAMDALILAKGSSTNDEAPADTEDTTDNSGNVTTTGKYVANPSKGMKWPVPYDNCYISAGYGYYSPFGSSEWHNGIDICVSGGSAGKDIVAAQNGKVIAAGKSGDSRGTYVAIDHGQGITTVYYHCSKVLVSVGQFVNKGDRIALIGQTGRVTGPHLHFGVHISDGNSVKKVDPLKYVSMP